MWDFRGLGAHDLSLKFLPGDPDSRFPAVLVASFLLCCCGHWIFGQYPLSTKASKGVGRKTSGSQDLNWITVDDFSTSRACMYCMSRVWAPQNGDMVYKLCNFGECSVSERRQINSMQRYNYVNTMCICMDGHTAYISQILIGSPQKVVLVPTSENPPKCIQRKMLGKGHKNFGPYKALGQKSRTSRQRGSALQF